MTGEDETSGANASTKLGETTAQKPFGRRLRPLKRQAKVSPMPLRRVANPAVPLTVWRT
jgi:hypothetical protein